MMFKAISLFCLITSIIYSTSIYSQCVTGDCDNGEGTYIYTNSVYWGNWKEGKRDGFGVLKMIDGSAIYKGNWTNDKKNGFGSYYWKSGDVYEGNWVADMQSGQCTYNWSNGDRFVGTFKDDKITENGTITRKAIQKLCISGNCYNGFGKFGYANAVYEGYFKNGKREGKGKTISWDGEIYEGDYENDLEHGKGKCTYSDGTVYDGDWVSGKRTGKGIYVWGKGKWEGDRYEGDFYENKRTGWGKYTFAKTGKIEEGNFDSDVFKGAVMQRLRVESTYSNNSSVAENATNTSSSQYNCNYYPSKPTGLTYELIDNRKACCYCEKYYAKYSISDYKSDEVSYLCELLFIHLNKEKVNLLEQNTHRDKDFQKLKDFISKNYGASYSILVAAIPTIPTFYAFSALSGVKKEIGSKKRILDKYTIESKFCSNECKTKCEYYGCNSCK